MNIIILVIFTLFLIPILIFLMWMIILEEKDNYNSPINNTKKFIKQLKKKKNNDNFIY